MKWYKASIIVATLTVFFSCNSYKSKNEQSNNADTVQVPASYVTYDDRRENLSLSVPDTIKKSSSYFFSSSQTKDLFLLTIEPGMVKNSKAKLQIITANNNVIYTQSFDAFYFIKWIYEPEPDDMPTTDEADVRERYLENYWRSITPEQYKSYFNRNVNGFLKTLYTLGQGEIKGLPKEEIINLDFWDEVLADSTIKVISIPCFDCDEGGTWIGYSRKQDKVVTLGELELQSATR